MQKIIVDIGSGNIKAYRVNDNLYYEMIFSKRIMLKEDFDCKTGLSQDKEQELINALLEIKKLVKKLDVYVYATSVFRLMDDDILKKYKALIFQKTGFCLNVISKDEENEYIAKSVGELFLDEPYLICCIGGSSTEIAVVSGNEIIENITVEFANADMINQFPELKKNFCEVKWSKLEAYVYQNMTFPKTKCKYVIMIGWHLLQTKAARFSLQSNSFFNHLKIPYYMDVWKYLEEARQVVESSNLQEFRNMVPGDFKVFDGFRGCCMITSCLLKEVDALYYFPTNLNMIDGIIRSFN